MIIRFLFLFFIYSSSASAEEIWLQLGEVRRVSANPEATIRVGQRGIVRVVEGDREITLVGLKLGSTTLAIDSRSFLVRVSRATQKSFQKALKLALKSMMGLSLQTDGQQIEITGTLLDFADWREIADLARMHQGEYVFKAQPLADVGKLAFAHFQSLAKQNGLPILRFTSSPNFRIHLPSDHSSLREAAEAVFKPYGIQVMSSKSDLAIQPLIRTQVVLAEVSKTVSRDFGVAWPREYQAQVLPVMEANQATLIALRALEARGQAQILASPNLLCRSGSQAQFHAGGEFPVRLISRNARDVMWKSHGVILKVKPRADFHGSISLEIETEISLLDKANSVDGVPAIKKNTVKSHFDLPGRRTIALSGLIRQELGDATEGLPYLSTLPVLGKLFGSESFQKRQSELVIFVTPEIYLPDADEPIKMPDGWIRREF